MVVRVPWFGGAQHGFFMPEAFTPASVDAVEAPDATFCDMRVKTVEFVKVPFISRRYPWTRLMVGVDVCGVCLLALLALPLWLCVVGSVNVESAVV